MRCKQSRLYTTTGHVIDNVCTNKAVRKLKVNLGLMCNKSVTQFSERGRNLVRGRNNVEIMLQNIWIFSSIAVPTYKTKGTSFNHYYKGGHSWDNK